MNNPVQQCLGCRGDGLIHVESTGVLSTYADCPWCGSTVKEVLRDLTEDRDDEPTQLKFDFSDGRDND